MARSFLVLLVVLMLLNLTFSQQVCLHRVCPDELKACNSDCAALMGNCTFECTLNSLGCLEQCMRGNQAAVNLLLCSFNKCINV